MPTAYLSQCLPDLVIACLLGKRPHPIRMESLVSYSSCSGMALRSSYVLVYSKPPQEKQRLQRITIIPLRHVLVTCYYDKIPNKSSLQAGVFWLTVWGCRPSQQEMHGSNGAEGLVRLCPNWEAGRGECWYLACFDLFLFSTSWDSSPCDVATYV